MDGVTFVRGRIGGSGGGGAPTVVAEGDLRQSAYLRTPYGGEGDWAKTGRRILRDEAIVVDNGAVYAGGGVERPTRMVTVVDDGTGASQPTARLMFSSSSASSSFGQQQGNGLSTGHNSSSPRGIPVHLNYSAVDGGAGVDTMAANEYVRALEEQERAQAIRHHRIREREARLQHHQQHRHPHHHMGQSSRMVLDSTDMANTASTADGCIVDLSDGRIVELPSQRAHHQAGIEDQEAVLMSITNGSIDSQARGSSRGNRRIVTSATRVGNSRQRSVEVSRLSGVPDRKIRDETFYRDGHVMVMGGNNAERAGKKYANGIVSKKTITYDVSDDTPARKGNKNKTNDGLSASKSLTVHDVESNQDEPQHRNSPMSPSCQSPSIQKSSLTRKRTDSGSSGSTSSSLTRDEETDSTSCSSSKNPIKDVYASRDKQDAKKERHQMESMRKASPRASQGALPVGSLGFSQKRFKVKGSPTSRPTPGEGSNKKDATLRVETCDSDEKEALLEDSASAVLKRKSDNISPALSADDYDEDLKSRKSRNSDVEVIVGHKSGTSASNPSRGKTQSQDTPVLHELNRKGSNPACQSDPKEKFARETIDSMVLTDRERTLLEESSFMTQDRSLQRELSMWDEMPSNFAVKSLRRCLLMTCFPSDNAEAAALMKRFQ